MAPWFEGAEKRLNVEPWAAAPNPNNELLRTGASKLGINAKVIPRNVKGCWNTGSCGMGCPTNAKQSMLITTIPTALTNGARLFHQTRAEKLEIKNGEVQGVVCSGIRVNGDRVSDKHMRVVAKHYVVSGGAINSPALLKRSDTPDPHGILGTRTFLHPVTFSSGVFSDKIEGWSGAPQTIYSDHYLHTQPVGGPIGFKIEATPMHPGLTSVLLGGVGADLAERFQHYPNTQLLLSLLRDGFHPESVGGTVMLNVDGSALLNYPITPYLLDGAKRSLLAMAEIQFAAGAQKVLPYHAQGRYFSNMAEAKAAIDQFAMEPFKTGLGSAHVMGGCRMGGSETQGVVQPDGTHWQVKNLSVHDGSLFPTSLGANPQLSIYGLTNRLATQLARKLTGKDVSLAA
jgi:choline dehydrogenase-like flavoprotein